MYAQDSFFDLTLVGRIGLVAITCLLAVLATWLAWKFLRNRSPVTRVLGALCLFWFFVWASPQVYYMYYRFLIEDLPLQWVILRPVGLGKVAELMLFQENQSLSAHGRGVLGWLMVLAPFSPWPRRRERVE